MRPSNSLRIVLVGAATALLAYFGTGLHPIWPLLWLAPVPALAVSPTLRPGATFLIAFVAWFIGELNQWSYFTGVLGIPLPIVIAFLVIPALLFGFGVLFTRSVLLRGSPILAALAFPGYWVTWEYLSALSSPHSTFGNLGYTQINFLPLVQVASVSGIWGLSFLVFLFASTVAVLATGIGKQSERRALALSVGALYCLVFVFGEWRLLTRPVGQAVRITLIAKDVPLSAYLGAEEQAIKLFAEYANEVTRLSPAGTQVVVLPEKIGRISENTLPQVDALFSAAASATQSAIDLGLVRRTSSRSYNSARFYSPEGKVVANYDKHHLVPGIEPEKPGTERVTLDQRSGRWGLQICKDMDFPQLSRAYAGEGANLLLVPAWDFSLDGWLHSRMAVLRAVENGFGLARCARNGLLTLADNRGRVLAEKPSSLENFVSLSGQLSLTTEKTFYTRTGDWFAWLCAGLFALLLGYRMVSRLRG
jgi:apolipoprotein N-acyltransferase